MFIRAVDEGLEHVLRSRLPLPEDIGDVSFEAPTGAWAAQLARLTVNLFLYDLDRSSQPGRAATTRIDAAGRPERRAPQPMIGLSYLVSAWAGNPRDEHQLLGDVVSIMAGIDTIPEQFLSQPVGSSIHVTFGADDTNRLRDVWSGVGGQLKASCIVHLSVAADTHDWRDEAPQVQRIEVLSSPRGVRAHA